MDPKQFKIKEKFSACKSNEEKYQLILSFATTLPPFPEEEKTPKNIVDRCQSLMYVHGKLVNGKLQFTLFSDALISKGLGGILLSIYNGEDLKYLFMNPPIVLKDIGLLSIISPGRAGGVQSLYQKMLSQGKSLI